MGSEHFRSLGELWADIGQHDGLDRARELDQAVAAGDYDSDVWDAALRDTSPSGCDLRPGQLTKCFLLQKCLSIMRGGDRAIFSGVRIAWSKKLAGRYMTALADLPEPQREIWLAMLPGWLRGESSVDELLRAHDPRWLCIGGIEHVSTSLNAGRHSLAVVAYTNAIIDGLAHDTNVSWEELQAALLLVRQVSGQGSLHPWEKAVRKRYTAGLALTIAQYQRYAEPFLSYGNVYDPRCWQPFDAGMDEVFAVEDIQVWVDEVSRGYVLNAVEWQDPFVDHHDRADWAVDLIRNADRLPPEVEQDVLTRAVTGHKLGWPRARRAAANLPGRRVFLRQELAAKKVGSRRGAADWLAQQPDAELLPDIAAAIAKEKSAPAHVQLVDAYVRCGGDISQVMTVDDIVCLSAKHKFPEKHLTWLNLYELPTLTWRAAGAHVDSAAAEAKILADDVCASVDPKIDAVVGEEVVRWVIGTCVTAKKAKIPTLVRACLSIMNRRSVDEFVDKLVEQWMVADLAPGTPEEVEEQAVDQVERQMFYGGKLTESEYQKPFKNGKHL